MFPDPYPDPKKPCPKITESEYASPLHLYRSIDSVQMRPNKEGDADYVVYKDYRVTFKLDVKTREIVVPGGILTDLASVPWYFRCLVSRVGPHLEAAILYDFLYIAWQSLCHKSGTPYKADPAYRKFADRLFLVAMKAAKVSWLCRHSIFWSVRLCGGCAFRKRDERRYDKESRLLEIMDAIPVLDVTTDFDHDGKPLVEALQEVLGYTIGQDECDKAWERYK